MRKITLAIAVAAFSLTAQHSMAQQAKEPTIAEKSAAAKAIYNHVKTKNNENAIDKKDAGFGLNYDLFTGGTSTLYKGGIDLYNHQEWLFAQKHMQFQFVCNIGYLMGGQKEWFASVFNTDPANVVKVPGTIRAGMGISFTGVVINKTRFGLSVGPTAGFQVNFMPSVEMEGVSNEYSSVPLMLNPTLGLRSNVYVGKRLYIGVAYNVAMKSSYTNELKDVTTTTPLNANSLTFSIGARGYRMTH